MLSFAYNLAGGAARLGFDLAKWIVVRSSRSAWNTAAMWFVPAVRTCIHLQLRELDFSVPVIMIVPIFHLL